MIKIGMIIGDRYEILEKIGTGGMSDVYKAKCHKLNRFVAMKVLKQEFSENANFVSKFRIEAQAAAGLSHPNIVNVYDVGEENGIYYIVMELVEGITLKKYIEKKARLSVKEAISIAIQICMGIEAAHNNHIIHRDIKPQNIIISKEGKVKVTDFGIAKAATSNTITSNVMGSVHYTSPEQARGGFSDAKSDIYSLGVTFFEMLTGRVPFNGETTVAIAIKHIQEEMASPREFIAEIPVSVERIVFKCCQKSPDRRYQSMGELIEDLKKSLMNPDQDFVKVVDPSEEASTRPISEIEVAQIKAARSRNSIEDPMVFRRRQEPELGYAGAAHNENDSGNARTGNAMAGNGSKINNGSRPEYGNGRKEYGGGRTAYEDVYYEDEYNDDYGDEEDYDYSPRKERLTTVLAIIAAILVGCVVLALIGQALGIFRFDWFTNDEAPEEQVAETELVEMIQVVGMELEEAKVALIGIGLTPEIEYEESTEYGSNIVIRASAAQGDMVNPENNVILTVSTGSEGVEVPELVGKTEEEAETMLLQDGFQVNRTEAFDEFIQAGSVLHQDPASGSKVPEGSTVTIRISLGKEDTKVRMPKLIGQTEMDAMVILEEAGLSLGNVTETINADPNLVGLVCYQSYSVDTYVELGTKVDLQVSTGTENQLYSYIGSIEGPTAGEDPNYKSGTMVTVTLAASNGTQLLSTQTASFPIPVSFTNIATPSGTLVFQYVNNIEEQTITQEDGSVIKQEASTENKEVVREIIFAQQQE